MVTMRRHRGDMACYRDRRIFAWIQSCLLFCGFQAHDPVHANRPWTIKATMETPGRTLSRSSRMRNISSCPLNPSPKWTLDARRMTMPTCIVNMYKITDEV
ncbi:hypothetical protein BDU57DRAFT_33482 [Ampelomyces quisqualis]|uniref:Uncharacterized protein n=1 Tax=Ampelomyces quisqualis TaxID=50730 RepID=A0A6A5QZ56_AMPQU|nr:hypothetical protein BDU57DRAFT_33482 [Ampelomyces quisqualis]